MCSEELCNYKMWKANIRGLKGIYKKGKGVLYISTPFCLLCPRARTHTHTHTYNSLSTVRLDTALQMADFSLAVVESGFYHDQGAEQDAGLTLERRTRRICCYFRVPFIYTSNFKNRARFLIGSQSSLLAMTSLNLGGKEQLKLY